MLEEAAEPDGGQGDVEIINQAPQNQGRQAALGHPPNRPRAAAARDAAREDALLLQDRNEVLRNLTTSVADLANRGQQNNARGQRCRHQVWSEHLAYRVVDMPPHNREKFKLHVDRVSLDAQAPDWEPPN